VSLHRCTPFEIKCMGRASKRRMISNVLSAFRLSQARTKLDSNFTLATHMYKLKYSSRAILTHYSRKVTIPADSSFLHVQLSSGMIEALFTNRYNPFHFTTQHKIFTKIFTVDPFYDVLYSYDSKRCSLWYKIFGNTSWFLGLSLTIVQFCCAVQQRFACHPVLLEEVANVHVNRSIR